LFHIRTAFRVFPLFYEMIIAKSLPHYKAFKKSDKILKKGLHFQKGCAILNKLFEQSSMRR
jgi:hypothetical protein